MVFQCSSASRKFLNGIGGAKDARRPRFQCSSASRKFLNRSCRMNAALSHCVSVLFSEPKIPQDQRLMPPLGAQRFQCSSASRKFLNSGTGRPSTTISSVSALQRAENSSTYAPEGAPGSDAGFSALQRAENSSSMRDWRVTLKPWGFSALQRAENSSISMTRSTPAPPTRFQCSSASRKFLNVR